MTAYSNRKNYLMSSNPFYEPIVVENFLDRLVFPAQRQEQPVEEYDHRLQESLRKLHRALYKLGASQGIHDPDIWRASVLSILEEHFGVPVT